MKKLVFLVAVAMGLVGSQLTAENEWSAEIGLTDSGLEKSTVWGGELGFFSGTDTSKSWDDEAIGLKVELGYQFNPVFKALVGWNKIDFDGENRADKFLNVVDVNFKMTDIELSTYYAGGEFTFAKAGKFDFYGTVEAGATKVNGVKETLSIPVVDFSLTEKVYDSSTNFYHSVGVGSKFNINESVYLDLAYQYRDFGKLEATRLFKEDGYKDIDLRTHSIDLSIGVKF